MRRWKASMKTEREAEKRAGIEIDCRCGRARADAGAWLVADDLKYPTGYSVRGYPVLLGCPPGPSASIAVW
jgi:hypothetical protein